MPAREDVLTLELTELEARVLSHLVLTQRPGYCPSREELSRAAGLGARGYRINRVLESLAAKQFIRLDPRRSRAIAVLRWPGGRPVGASSGWVAVVGLIGASRPRETATQVDNACAEEAIELTRGLVRGHEGVFALRVSGRSMVDALVSDGDIVVLSNATPVHNGDMVAAQVTADDGTTATTLKYYYRENGHVRLQHANAALPPLPLYRSEQVQVCGKVLLVIRQMP